MKSKEFKKGVRFSWTKQYKHPLCLQSREYNGEMSDVTWVYYSKSEAKKLMKFLNEIFK